MVGVTERPPAEEVATVDTSPSRAASLVALFASLVVVAAIVPQEADGDFALVVVGGGILLFGLGLLVGHRGVLTLGIVVQLTGLIGAGVLGLPPAQVLLGLAALLLAWDLGQYAVVLGQQVGAGTDSMRTELIHAGVLALAIAATAVVANGIFATASGGKPLSALAALAVAVVLFLLVLRE